MNGSRKETIDAYGRHLAEYMKGKEFAGFVMHSSNPNPLGINGLGHVPIAWIAEMKVPGFIVERVGRDGIRIW